MKSDPFRGVVMALAVALGCLGNPLSAQVSEDAGGKVALSIADVLAIEQVDRATASPDGELVAAVIRRGVNEGDVFGRASYDVDPTRADVWLLSTRDGQRRSLTHGLDDAAGYWCATWSPSGRRLAMLSTAPGPGEPRGGNNVRLYVWDRGTPAPVRVSDYPLMTQSRFGSAIDKLDVRGGADQGSSAHACHIGVVGENAPFAWLDDDRLLAVTLPDGDLSIAVDQDARRYRSLANDAASIRRGTEPTVSVAASGDAAEARLVAPPSAIIRVLDVRHGTGKTIATVPAYPFRGGLTVSVSPDKRSLAVLATVAALPPRDGRQFPNLRESAWTSERRLGFADLATGKGIRWPVMPAAARYPLELYGWSPSGRSVAFRARSSPYDARTPLFAAGPKDERVRPVGRASVGGETAGAERPRPPAVRWADDRRLLAQTVEGKWLLMGEGRDDAEVIGAQGLTAAAIVRARDQGLIAIVGRRVLRVEPGTARLKEVAGLQQDGLFLTPSDMDTPSDRRLILLRGADGAFRMAFLDTRTASLGPSVPAVPGELLEADGTNGRLLYARTGSGGSFLDQTDFTSGHVRTLATLNPKLSRINWGETRAIDYQTAGGSRLRAAVILPPDYDPGRRYPTLAWVYAGYEVRSLEDDFLTGPLQAGLYNLRLYAAQGYVVVVPSIPLDRHRTLPAQIPAGVMPALDKLVDLGISDPERFGLFGQSFGGYTVYGLLGQTDRFKAAVAIAGVSDVSGLFGEFDPTARGWPGIEHEKSDNWSEIGQFGEQKAPWEDPEGYAANSPLSYVGKVTTPLLMIHGDGDIRGSDTQAERFFYALYSMGRTAELRRYGGEGHGLAHSPANIRDAFRSTVAWFDRYLKADAPRDNAGKSGTPTGDRTVEDNRLIRREPAN